MARGGRAAVEVEGGPRLRKAFRRLGKRADELKSVHRDAGEIVLRRAHELVPRLDGDLASSHRLSVRATGVSVTAGAGLEPYAGPVHFGWRAHSIEPSMWLYDAIDDTRADVAREYDRAVGEMVERLDREAPP